MTGPRLLSESPAFFGANFGVDGGATQDHIAAAVASSLIASPTITILVDDTSATTVRVDSRNAGGSAIQDFVLSGASTSDRATDLASQMTANSSKGRDVATYFKVTASGSAVTLKPRVGYPVLRDINIARQSGTGVTITNLDGTAITTATAVARARMGGTLRLPAATYDGQTGSQTPVVIDVPNTILRGEPGTVWRAAATGALIVEASGFVCEDIEFLWEEEGSNGRNGAALALMAASDWTFRNCDFTADSFANTSSTANIITCAQVTATYPHHRSYSFRRSLLDNCNWYLGNDVAPWFLFSVFDFTSRNCLITSKYQRSNAFGNGALASTEVPGEALIQNSDYIDIDNLSILNIGGHTNGNDYRAPLVIERTSSGYDSTHEGGHITIRGGRVHGTRTHYAAQILLRRLWFARVEYVEMHRHLIPNPTGGPVREYENDAGLLVEDCGQVIAKGLEGFNFGADGGDYARYPFIGVKSLLTAQQALGAPAPKMISVSDCTYEASVQSSGTGTNTANSHPFFIHYATKWRPTYDVVSVTDNTIIAGGFMNMKFRILDNLNFAAGEGFVLGIPANAFGASLPATATTITVDEGTYFNKSGTNPDVTAQNIVTSLMNDTLNFQPLMRAFISETSYHETPINTEQSMYIEAKYHGASGSTLSVVIEHLSSVASTSALTTNGTTIAEGASGAMEGGFGLGLTADGQPGIWMTDPYAATQKPRYFVATPKVVRVSGNVMRGMADGFEVFNALFTNYVTGDQTPPDTQNTYTDDNTYG